ncbi:hypothetical protein BDN67DRAFT_967353 [Paxillus ammoniavirescens]|nr:hypothetical protein BDN67DRAFT_967353 [Paxillus ammoniavirescens]
MNIRPPADMLRPQQSMPQLAQVPMNSPTHFLPTPPQPGQQQQPPNHMGLMPHGTSPSMAMLGGGVQNAQTGLHATSARYQMRQSAMQQGQNPQMNASAAAAGASHMAALGHNPLQSMAFPASMMQQGMNGVPVRRVQSHPQGLNQAAGHVPGIHPAQQALNGINMTMNQQVPLPTHLRQTAQQPMMSRIQGSMPGSMSPDLMGRQANATGVPQNTLRTPSAQAQIMSSLSQPSGIPQGGLQQSMSQNSFQPTVPGHPHHTPSLTSSSPRPGGHPQQQHAAANMMMGQPGPSQATGPRPMSHGDSTFIGLQNHSFPSNMVPGSNRIPNTNPAFSFAPPVPQNDGLEVSQSVGEGLPNTSNPSIRPSFQPTPAQHFEQLQQNDNFGAHFTLQSQGNPPPPARPPSHPSSAHGSSIPSRQMQPPHQHSPRQSDQMAAHVQQQPQRPQSEPQGPPGRPPSQAGPSHTPRSSQPQLPPSSGLLPSTRITSHNQTQSSPHQRRQSPSVQQPIAPRPPQGPTSNPPATNVTSSEASTSQSQSAVIQRPPVMAMPLGLGQGLVRLLQFSGQLSSESPHKHQLSYWDAFVREYFTPKAIMKVTLWKDNQRNEAKPFEIGVPILPRFFLVTTQSGVKSMTLSLDGARERLVSQQHAIVECVGAVWTYKYNNGYTVTLRGPMTVHVVIIPVASPAQAQQSQITLRFDHFQFDANTHEKYISLDSIVGQRAIESPKTPRVRNAPTPSPNGASSSQRAEEDRQWEEPRVLIDHASIPGEPVNAFGIPQATMRCLELAESVSQMTDLISFANDTQLGPMDALSALAKKLREGPHNPPMNGSYMGPVLGSGPGPGGFQGYGGPTSALYPGMSPSSIPTHSMPSGGSPQTAPPPSSADTPQKQSKPPTSGPAPPAPNQPPAPSQAGLTSTPAGTLKRKSNDTNSPTIANVEPQSKRTRKPKRNG